MVNKDNIRMFVTDLGLIIGEYKCEDIQGRIITLHHPFRIMPNDQGTVTVTSVYFKEEWIKVDPSEHIELSLNDGLIDLYMKYEQQVFGTVVIATSADSVRLGL